MKQDLAPMGEQIKPEQNIGKKCSDMPTKINATTHDEVMYVKMAI